MTSIFDGQKTTIICSRCDEDPLTSQNVRKLIQSVKALNGEPEEPAQE
jgi:hypothetical protein